MVDVITNPILKKLAGAKVLVIGDVVLDHFVWGEVDRISPEAPVPIVRVLKEDDMPGAAANVALNLASIDARPVMLSVIGNDNDGNRLRELLLNNNVDCNYLKIDSGRKTTRKTRIIARSQHVVRVDWDSKIDSDVISRHNILSSIEKAISDCEAVIVQDYNKGMIQQSVFDLLENADVPVIIDPNRYHSIKYFGTLATPNADEAEILSGVNIGNDEVIDHLPEIADAIFKRNNLEKLIITLSEKGLALCDKNGEIKTMPVAKTHSVYDVSGAGDTIVAALAAALAKGIDTWEACKIANAAAAIVVGKMGTATATRLEIQKLLNGQTRDLPLQKS